MKTTLASKTTLLALALAFAALPASVVASPPDPSPANGHPLACLAHEPLTIDLDEYGTQLGLITPGQVVGPPGAPPPVAGVGSASVMVGELRIGDKVVGTSSGTCLTVGASSPTATSGNIQLCNQTLTLTALPAPYDKLTGTIVVNGPIDRDAFHGNPQIAGDGVPQVLAVTGGTGSFRAAGGQLRVRESSFNEHVQVWSLAELLCR